MTNIQELEGMIRNIFKSSQSLQSPRAKVPSLYSAQCLLYARVSSEFLSRALGSSDGQGHCWLTTAAKWNVFRLWSECKPLTIKPTTSLWVFPWLNLDLLREGAPAMATLWLKSPNWKICQRNAWVENKMKNISKETRSSLSASWWMK